MNREPFRTQYLKCHTDGMHGKGPILKWKDHPELWPFCPAKARKVIEVLKKDPEAGISSVSCLRFGGDCTSAKPECRALRGLTHKQP